MVIEYAAESENRTVKLDIEGFFSEAADELDKIKDIHHKTGQWYLALAALTCDKSQGRRDRCWLWKWHRSMKKAGEARCSRPCKMDELAGPMEKCHHRKDEKGVTFKLSSDLTMTPFESRLACWFGKSFGVEYPQAEHVRGPEGGS